MYIIWLNNYLSWTLPVSWTELGSFSSGLSWIGLNKSSPRPTHQFYGSSWPGPSFPQAQPTRPKRPAGLDGLD
ncbi:hypothetical protein BVRB_4g072430 [Beta vulgaris subsp. vulgaris]|nr:hypothetical protein BVRB_4g072430 [Beta vulgaris subsp. vulgaris]